MQKKRVIFSTFTPLKDKNFSVYASGQLISLIGSMMQNTALSWVVWQMTKSTADLGIVVILGALPMLLLGAFTGRLLDSVNRRKLLIATQITAMVAALGFAAMLQLKLAGLWQIYLLAVVLGLVMALDTPAQSAFVGDITGREHMQGAIVLNSMIMQLSRTLGPALAGVMLSIFSSSSVFWINGASFLFVIGTLFAIRTRKETEKPPSGADSMNDAFKFVRKNPRALDLIIICVIMTFFAFGTGTLLPAIVTDTLHKGASTMGLLEGVTGAGPLLGSFIIVPLVSRVKHSGRLLTFALCYLGTLMLILALSSYFFISVWFWVVSMFLSTFAVPVIMTISNTILQHIAPENMRGRLINVMFMFAFGLQPFGSLIIGFLGSAFGSIFAFEIYGMALILGGLIMIIFRKGLFDWQPMKGGI